MGIMCGWSCGLLLNILFERIMIILSVHNLPEEDVEQKMYGEGNNMTVMMGYTDAIIQLCFSEDKDTISMVNVHYRF